jgi:hypothetical protein
VAPSMAAISSSSLRLACRRLSPSAMQQHKPIYQPWFCDNLQVQPRRGGCYWMYTWTHSTLISRYCRGRGRIAYRCPASHRPPAPPCLRPCQPVTTLHPEIEIEHNSLSAPVRGESYSTSDGHLLCPRQEDCTMVPFGKDRTVY